jgi:hypothetical protein
MHELGHLKSLIQNTATRMVKKGRKVVSLDQLFPWKSKCSFCPSCRRSYAQLCYRSPAVPSTIDLYHLVTLRCPIWPSSSRSSFWTVGEALQPHWRQYEDWLARAWLKCVEAKWERASSFLFLQICFSQTVELGP